jgi:hypothetical protein
MDIRDMWRSMHPDEVPRPGVHQEAPAGGITITVAQQCQVALPQFVIAPDEISVTVTSGRPGVAGQVSVSANLNSLDGTYQGPTSAVGQGQFTATSSEVQVGFVVVPTAGLPYVGVGAEVTWADGAPGSIALTYWEIECDGPVWWSWLMRLVAYVPWRFSARH